MDDAEKKELIALLIGYRHLVRRQRQTAPNGGNLAYWEKEARRTEDAIRKLKGLAEL